MADCFRILDSSTRDSEKLASGMDLCQMIHGAGIFTIIYLQNWVIYGVNVGKYNSTMDHLGMFTFFTAILKRRWDLIHGSPGFRHHKGDGHVAKLDLGDQ